jgi:hypothetical protein
VVPLLKFTVLRLTLFVGPLLLLAALGAHPLVAIGGAAVISILLSYVLLRGPRQALSEEIAARVDRRATMHRPTEADEDAAIEDAADDEARRTAPPS